MWRREHKTSACLSVFCHSLIELAQPEKTLWSSRPFELKRQWAEEEINYKTMEDLNKVPLKFSIGFPMPLLSRSTQELRWKSAACGSKHRPAGGLTFKEHARKLTYNKHSSPDTSSLSFFPTLSNLSLLFPLQFPVLFPIHPINCRHLVCVESCRSTLSEC